MLKIAIIIVNYRTAKLACKCIDSIVKNKSNKYETSIFIVDNDSNDDSGEILSKKVDTTKGQVNLEFIPSSINGGYAYGNNLAIKHINKHAIKFDYFWLLNPDTEIKLGADEALIAMFHNNNNIGICGSQLQDANGMTQASAFRFPGVVSESLNALKLGFLDKLFVRHKGVYEISSIPVRVDWVAGASMMIKASVLEKAPEMDEKFFLYYEEVDYCLKVKNNAWECWYVPGSKVIHYVGAATGISDMRKKAPRRPRYWFDSRRRYFIKNNGKTSTLVTDVVFMICYFLWRLRRQIQKKDDLDPPMFLWDYFKNSVICKGFKI